MNIEQMITLGLALFLAVKYIFFEQVEMESTLSLKVPTSGSLLNQKWSPDQCCRKEVSCSSKPAEPLVVTKEERGIPLNVPYHFVLISKATVFNGVNFSFSDLVIRPLTAPKEHEQKTTFVLGQVEAQENIDMWKSEINLPVEPRPVEDCLSILKNPDVIVDPYIVKYAIVKYSLYLNRGVKTYIFFMYFSATGVFMFYSFTHRR